jgi:1-phosphofructokinase
LVTSPHDEGESSICVFASSLVLTVTIEAPESEEGDEIHLHPGGQGFWIARMIDRLGAGVVLVAPLGGESGKVIGHLIDGTGIELSAIERQDDSPVYIHDRRSGMRLEVAEQLDPGLSRHETDDLYSRTLETAIRAGTIVITGRYGAGGIPESFYSRLAADLDSLDVSVIGDLHGVDLDSFLETGEIDLLKLSMEDLRADGVIGQDGADIGKAVDRLAEKGAKGVVVSGGEDGSSLAKIDDTWYRVEQPSLEAADFRGSGDSMTAGLAIGMQRRLAPVEMLRLAAAAGAANAVRRGLGSADAELTEALNDTVTVTEIGDPNDI